MNDPLNKQETQELIEENPHLGIIDRHAEGVSKAKLVLIVVCLVAIVVSFILNRTEQSGLGERITKVESPCLRYGSASRECHESFQAAIDSITDFQLCDLLSKRPDLTGVSAADCRRIAREVRERAAEARRKSRVANALLERGSLDSLISEPPGNTQEEGSNAPSGGGVSPSPDSDRNPNNPGSGRTPASPPQQDSPTVPIPAGSPASESQPSQPGGQATPPNASAPESSSNSSSVVEVEVPPLPAHVCVPGVVSVNCQR